MTDNLNERGPADRTRVNMHEKHEVKYWTGKWAITEAQLKEAHDSVGVTVDKIEDYLRKKGFIKKS
jgi:hypothetical protein